MGEIGSHPESTAGAPPRSTDALPQAYTLGRSRGRDVVKVGNGLRGSTLSQPSFKTGFAWQ